MPSVDFKQIGSWADSYKIGDTVTVCDMSLFNTISGDTLVEKMNYTVKYYGTEVTVNDGKFNIEHGGKYVVEYTATYEEIEYKKAVEITVDRVAPAADEVESFGDASVLDNISMSYAFAPEYITDLSQGPENASEFRPHGLLIRLSAIREKPADNPSATFPAVDNRIIPNSSSLVNPQAFKKVHDVFSIGYAKFWRL